VGNVADKPKRKPPLRTCSACGGRFRSWAPERYCSRSSCRELRLFGPSGEPEPAPAELERPYHDPATAPWPEGF
jgi:hypothetical protein